ncbi:MAG: hypothetical protein ACOY9I_14530 [Pseudomonadota bacterium]
MSSRYEDINADLKGLVFDFFYWFSRFEFALKETETFSKKGKYGNVEPDWDAFQEKYKDVYSSSAALRALLEDPPKQERYLDKMSSRWEPVTFKSRDKEIHKAVRLVKTIRNNLFHGGKSSKTGWDDPERIRFLLPRALEILHSLAELDSNVYAHFSHAY